MQRLPHTMTHGSLPPEYWNNLNSMYPDQLQPQSMQQQDPAAQKHQPQQQHSEPMGIDWDHPIFQQQQQQFQQRGHPPLQTDPNHGIYSAIPQSWQANPLQQPTREYQVSPQYQTDRPPSQFVYDQRSFETRPLNPSESSAFPSYAYHSNYLQSPALSGQETMSSRSSQQHQQSTNFAATGAHSSPSTSAGFAQNFMDNNTIDLTNDFSVPPNGTSQHQTIDPQYLSPVQGTIQTSNLQQNPLLYGGPNNFQAPSGGNFNYFENAFSVQPQTDAPKLGAESSVGACFRIICFLMMTDSEVGVSGITGLPQPQVVIPVQKGLLGDGRALKKKPRSQTQKKPSDRSEGGSSDSDLEIEAPDEPSPLPPTRPGEPVAAAEYDTLKAVWSPRNKWPSADKVKSALVAFKDVIKALRDTWKDQVQAMKVAENQGDNDKASMFKQQAALQRRVMDRIVVTTLNLGHTAIVEKYAFPPLVSFFSRRFTEHALHGHRSLKQIESINYVICVKIFSPHVLWLHSEGHFGWFLDNSPYISNPSHMNLTRPKRPKVVPIKSLHARLNKLLVGYGGTTVMAAPCSATCILRIASTIEYSFHRSFIAYR